MQREGKTTINSVEDRGICPKLNLDQAGAAQWRPRAWEMGSEGRGTLRLS